MENGKILVVEDQDAMRESLMIAFKDEGYQVEGAASGEEAIQKLENRNVYDLVVTDLKMKKVDGLEVLKTVKASNQSTEVVLITAYGTISTAVQAIRDGAYDYVTKPFKFSVLLARIRAHLRSHQQSEDAVFKIGQYTFRPSAKLLTGPNNTKIGRAHV